MKEWIEKKNVRVPLSCLCIVAVIAGAIFGATDPSLGLDNEVLDRALSALFGAFVLGSASIVVVILPVSFLISLLQDIKQRLKSRAAKKEAYFMIEAGRIFNRERFEEISEILSEPGYGSSETRLLLRHLQELEQNENHIKKVP